MTKYDKLIQKIFAGKSDVTPDEAIKILEMLDFKATPTGGSHLISGNRTVSQLQSFSLKNH